VDEEEDEPYDVTMEGENTALVDCFEVSTTELIVDMIAYYDLAL